MKPDPTALRSLKRSFRRPPRQGPVGFAPNRYLQGLPEYQNGPYASSIALIPGRGRKKLSRIQVRNICRNRKIRPLVAYAVAMAWGGQRMNHYRSSLAGAPTLHRLIADLRKRNRPRRKDFAAAKKACASIKGLKISFFTKLLFFFRQRTDAYILDKWTGMSVRFLFPNGPIRLVRTSLPYPATSPRTYDWFCRHLVLLRRHLGPHWPNGEAVERTLFDRPNGRWRKILRGPSRTKIRQTVRFLHSTPPATGGQSPPANPGDYPSAVHGASNLCEGSRLLRRRSQRWCNQPERLAFLKAPKPLAPDTSSER